MSVQIRLAAFTLEFKNSLLILFYAFKILALSYVQPMLLLVSLNRRFETASAALLVVLRSKTKEQLAQLLSFYPMRRKENKLRILLAQPCLLKFCKDFKSIAKVFFLRTRDTALVV